MFCRVPIVFGVALITALTLAPVSAYGIDFSLRGIDVHGGANFPSGWDSGFTVGVSASVATITEGLYLQPGLFYSKASTSSFGAQLGVSTLAVGAEGRYFPKRKPNGFYFGGGPYVNVVRADVAIPIPVPGAPEATSSVSSNSVGVLGVAGYRRPLSSPMSGIFAEIRFNAASAFHGPQILVGASFGPIR